MKLPKSSRLENWIASGKDASAHRARAPVTHHEHPEIRLVCPETPCHSHAWRPGAFPAQVTMKKQPDIYDVGLAVVFSIADLIRSSSTEEIFSDKSTRADVSAARLGQLRAPA
uniref:Uncharacterized protein n=1 Tax=Heliothis virescens TaxID=7102 RepID=A0A2A4J022_HELVI